MKSFTSWQEEQNVHLIRTEPLESMDKIKQNHLNFTIQSKLKWCFLVISCILLFPASLYAQSGMSRDSTEYILANSPAFSIYKDNYFITGTALGEEPSKYNSDIKFQFSFKQRLQNKPVFAGSYLYLTYTQKSFWDVYQASSPFTETNYNPGLMLAKPIYKDDKVRSMLMLSIEHESNGRDSIYSRSWNYIGINYSHHFSSRIRASLKLVIPFGLKDNPDLLKYNGLAEWQFTWDIKKEKLVLDIIGRKSAEWNTKGSLMTTISFRPSPRRNLYWTLQWYQGYSESLIDYRESTNMLRVGLMFKPSFFRFY